MASDRSKIIDGLHVAQNLIADIKESIEVLPTTEHNAGKLSSIYDNVLKLEQWMEQIVDDDYW